MNSYDGLARRGSLHGLGGDTLSSVSIRDDDLVNSPDNTAGSYSPNCCEEAAVDVFPKNLPNKGIFETFQHTRLCSVSGLLTIFTIGADMALPT